jgi:hypothetical protein
VIPRRIHNSNVKYGPPEGWDNERDGHCSNLYVRRDNATCASAWEPTPQELELLNKGGSVVLTIWGAQPPVALSVELVTDPEETPG